MRIVKGNLRFYFLVLVLAVTVLVIFQMVGTRLRPIYHQVVLKAMATGPKTARELSPSQYRDLMPHLSECSPKLQKPDERKLPIRHVHWQEDPDVQLDAYYYRAYFDNRITIGHQAIVRVMGIVGHYKQLFCHVWYEGVSTPYVTAVDFQLSHAHYHTVHGRTYKWAMFNCKLNNFGPAPTHVSIATGKCKQSTILLPIHVSKPDKPLQEFLVCVPTAYGNRDPQLFVEWIEFNRIMGVGEIWMYESTILHDRTRNLFNYYQDRGIINRTAITNPWGYTNFTELYLTHPMVLNDCLYQNINRFKYVVELDVDEFIVPRLDDNWHDMLIRIRNTQRVTPELHGFHFLNAYFFLHEEREKNEQLVSLSHRNRAVMKYTQMIKTIDTVSRCEALSHHFCSKVIQVYHRVNVKEELAEKFHYRECPRHSIKNCTFPLFREMRMDHFRAALQQNVKSVMNDFHTA